MTKIFSTFSAAFLVSACVATAAPISINLNGATSFDGWHNITAGNFPGRGSFPGSMMWAPIGSNVADSSDADLVKIANGANGGGPYPASSSIYYGSFGGGVNAFGGTLAARDTTPLASLKTLVFQIEIGEASTYDFYNHALPTLSYTTAGGTTNNVTANFSSLISQVFNGTVTMPSGEEPLYINTWGLQWDLTGVTGITEFSVSWGGVEHAQVYALQLNQSDVTYATSVLPASVPEPSTWLLLGLGLSSLVIFRARHRSANA